MSVRTGRRWRPLEVEVTWDDPRSSHDSWSLDDVLVGKGAGLQRNRKTIGYLCFINEEYLVVYSDYDEEDNEVGGSTAIHHVLIHKVRIVRGKVLYIRGGGR